MTRPTTPASAARPVSAVNGPVSLPAFDDLPVGRNGARRAWHQFGPDDNLGMINLLTPDVVQHAAGLVRRGAVFALNAPADLFDPAPFGTRGTPRHRRFAIARPHSMVMDDVIDNFYPQASSQWDALAHASYDTDTFYNGASRDDIETRHRNTIEHWARCGIVGRAVVLDLTDGTSDYVPGGQVTFGVADLERARLRAGLEYRDGDILLLHTGFTAWYAGLGRASRQALPRNLTAIGLEHSEEVCRYLWQTRAAAVATDTLTLEAWPPDHSGRPYGFLHQTLIGGFGMAVGELWWLDDLMADCRADGVHQGMLVSAPMNMPGGTGSPANAVVIK